MTITSRIRAAQELQRKATPGPFRNLQQLILGSENGESVADCANAVAPAQNAAYLTALLNLFPDICAHSLAIEQENQRLRDMLRDAVVLLRSAGDEQVQGAAQSGTAWWHEQASELDSALSTPAPTDLKGGDETCATVETLTSAPNCETRANNPASASNAEPSGPIPDGLGNNAVHNPDNLTPDQIGEGWRLRGKDELIQSGDEWYWRKDQKWNKDGLAVGLPAGKMSMATRTRAPLPAPQVDPAEATVEVDALSREMKALGFGERHTYPYVKCLELARTIERQRNAAREDAERLAGELKFVLHELEVASTSVPSERMSIMDELIRRLPGFAALKSHPEENK